MDVGTESAAVNGEVPHLAVRVDNARGEFTVALTEAPLRARATLSRNGVPEFEGAVQSVTLGAVNWVVLES